MVQPVATPLTRPCPGRCGREIDRREVFGCLRCNRKLPDELRCRIWVTWWAEDWPAHSRAVADALIYLADHR